MMKTLISICLMLLACSQPLETMSTEPVVALPQAPTVAAAVQTLSVNVVSAKGVRGIDLFFWYNPVSTTVIDASTDLKGWMFAKNLSRAGSVRISMATGKPVNLVNTEIVYLVFKGAAPLLKSAIFNEGRLRPIVTTSTR